MKGTASALGALALVAVVLAMGGYACSKSKGGTPGASGALFQTREEMAPSTPPGAKAKLNFNGVGTTGWDVVVKTQQNGPHYLIDLWAYGEKFEEEAYEDLPKGFYLRLAAGERYDPSIPLLQFPLHVGDQYTWTGLLGHGDQSEKAKATVTTSEDSLSVAGADVKTVRVEVNFLIENGTPKPAQRKLTFWFQPLKGVIKRDFGGASARVPVGN